MGNNFVFSWAEDAQGKMVHVASGPLITTINDLVAVVTYYGLAWILLIDVMGF